MRYERLPEHMRFCVKEYIEKGRIDDEFLEAIVANKLKESFMAADDINRHRIYDYVAFFWNDAPSDCWGSFEKMQAWIKMGGLAGLSSRGTVIVPGPANGVSTSGPLTKLQLVKKE